MDVNLLWAKVCQAWAAIWQSRSPSAKAFQGQNEEREKQTPGKTAVLEEDQRAAAKRAKRAEKKKRKYGRDQNTAPVKGSGSSEIADVGDRPEQREVAAESTDSKASGQSRSSVRWVTRTRQALQAGGRISETASFVPTLFRPPEPSDCSKVPGTRDRLISELKRP